MQISPSTYSWAVVAVAFLVQVASASAWSTMQVKHHLAHKQLQLQLDTIRRPLQFSRVNKRSASCRSLKKRPLKSSEMDDDADDDAELEVDYQPVVSAAAAAAVSDDDSKHNNNNNNKRRKIEITSQVDLPFSPEVAYDAYSDLTRQPSWSSWLHSVEYITMKKKIGNDGRDQENDQDRDQEQEQQSKWTMKFMGVKYSWTAISTKNVRPHIIQWESTSGLRNFGTVRFEQSNDMTTSTSTTTQNTNTKMIMKMTLVAPRAVSLLFRRSKGLTTFVQDRMITASMLEFRRVVLEEDLNPSPRENME
jgi:uncharacterized membrane protein